MRIMFLVLVGFLLGITNAQYPCTTAQYYQELVAPAVIVQDPYQTGTFCWKITGAASWTFLNYSIGTYYNQDFFYFYDAHYDAVSGNNAVLYTQGSYITYNPSYSAQTGVWWVYFRATSANVGVGYWALSVAAVPAGAACTTIPTLGYPGGAGVFQLGAGTCNPSGTTSGQTCTLGCASPRVLYVTTGSNTAGQYTDVNITCNAGTWMTIKYPSFCYAGGSVCSGADISSAVSSTAFTYTSCVGQNYNVGDTCVMSCASNYVANPSYLPVYFQCSTSTNYNTPYPYLVVTGWSQGSNSAYCQGPCLSLPYQAIGTAYPGYASGTCTGGNTVAFGSTCSLTCNPGYKQIGSLEQVCLYGGWQYVSSGSCEDHCTTPYPPTPNFVAGCTVPADSRTTCLLSCATGYTQSGDLTATCVNGNWLPPPGTCAAPCTTPPVAPPNGTYNNCVLNASSGTMCDLTCNPPSVYATLPFTVCTNGAWAYETCQFYQWNNNSFGPCQASGVSCVAGTITSNGGIQTRAVNCVIQGTNTIVPDSKCQNTNSNAGQKPADSQTCSIPCPQNPSIQTATAYDGAVALTIQVWDPVPNPNSATISVSYCVATSSTGTCTFSQNSPLNPSISQLIPFGAVNGVYNAVNGRVIPIVYYNLTDGTTYQFRAVYRYISSTGVWQASQYSASSSAVTPSVAAGCYGGCVNGKCLKGFCACNPGAVYPLGSNCSTPATLTVPTFGFSPYTITPYLIPGVNPDSELPTYGPVIATWTTNIPGGVNVYFYPEACRSSTQCIPIAFQNFVQGGSVSQYLYNVTVGGSYFIRLFYTSQLTADSVSFQVLDPSCNGITCSNGGTCFGGDCQCTAGFTGATCQTPLSGCAQQGLDCGIWGTCSGSSCQCVAGWSGNECQYPPNCGIRCSNGGWPNDPLLATQPGNNWGCTYCQCEGNWQGLHCDQCGVECYNGGSITTGCSGCTCPTWYTGASCQEKYWVASWEVNLNPPAPFSFTNTYDQAMFQSVVLGDLQASGIPGYPVQYEGNSVGNTFTLWISGGEQSVVVRDNIKRQLFGTNYWESGNAQGLAYQATLTGDASVASSYSEQNPPNAAGFTTPSGVITLAILMLLGLLMN